MTPIRLYHLTSDLEMVEIFYHPYHQAFRYVACNVRALICWMLTSKLPEGDYLRFESEKKSDIHRRLTLKWNLMEYLKTKLK